MIPSKAHFVWFGRSFPWIYGMALRTAARRGGFEEVILHHEDDLDREAGWRVALDTPGVSARRLAPRRLLEATGDTGSALADLYSRLKQPAARSNMVRAAILATDGGVYLDTDIITVASFEPLMGAGVFCGAERIALPGALSRTRRPDRWAAAGLRLLARDILRRAPRGYRAFSRLEGLYPAVVNNAVLASRPGHPFVVDLLRRMLEMPASRQLVRFALGTHLLEEAVSEYRGDDLAVHPPRVFYPLGPEISEHWFREYDGAETAEIVGGETVCVHWYASVRTARVIPAIDPAQVARTGSRRLMSALLLDHLDPHGAAAAT